MKKKDFEDMVAARECRILTDNREFYHGITKNYYGKKAKVKAKVAAPVICGAACYAKPPVSRATVTGIVAALVCIAIFFGAFFATGFFGVFNEGAPSLDFPGYGFENERSTRIPVSKIDCPQLDLTFPETDDFIVSARRVHDYISGDLLFYGLTVDTDKSTIPMSLEIYLYPNDRFYAIKKIDDPQNFMTIGGVEYGYNLTKEVVGDVHAYGYNLYARLVGLEIYIDYNELTYGQPSHLEELLGSYVNLSDWND